MHVTFFPMKHPSRIEDPPGTIRIPSSKDIAFNGKVILSKKGNIPCEE
jgi:hypothetical protein